MESRHNIFMKGRGRGRRIGKLNEGKRDKIEVRGSWKGQCVSNFVANCRSRPSQCSHPPHENNLVLADKQGNLTDVGVWEGEKLLIVLTSHPWIGKLHLTPFNNLKLVFSFPYLKPWWFIYFPACIRKQCGHKRENWCEFVWSYAEWRDSRPR